MALDNYKVVEKHVDAKDEVILETGDLADATDYFNKCDKEYPDSIFEIQDDDGNVLKANGTFTR